MQTGGGVGRKGALGRVICKDKLQETPVTITWPLR